jgi:NAD(P)H dehydrogenase (quinone)
MTDADRPARITVIQHSCHGRVRAIAGAAANGARRSGANVRFLQVPDGAPATNSRERIARPGDVLWADGLILASPTYFENVSSALKQFLERMNPWWLKGLLADRVVATMTSSNNIRGGREATLLSVHQTIYHWGSWAIGTDRRDKLLASIGGNPYGISVSSHPSDSDCVADIASMRLGARLAGIASRKLGAAGHNTTCPVHVLVVHDDQQSLLDLISASARGAENAGARVRVRRVVECTVEDLRWADAAILGITANLGLPASSMVSCMQSMCGAATGFPLHDKPVSGFVASESTNTGPESRLLVLCKLLLHCGAVIVPPVCTDPRIARAGGNAYGTSSGLCQGTVTNSVVAAAFCQGERIARAGAALRSAIQPLRDSSCCWLGSSTR